MTSMSVNGKEARPANIAKHTAAVKIAIHAVTQAGTTTSPSAATPRPAISEAAVAWVATSSAGKA